ncbi:MAG: DUF1800 domain-containing protein [Rhodothermales bacterium]|nr:DUF1800 domain-containing protein [Rhodothermales bacterium]
MLPRSLPTVPSTSLAPYGAPLTAADVRHLLRRTGFGAPHARVQPLVGRSAAEAVRQILDEAEAAPILPAPAWLATPQTNIAEMNGERDAWTTRMLAHPVRERLALFWHHHFATEIRDYVHAASGWTYYTLCRTHALGNVRTLVHAMGLNPAMLRYLNGNQSTKAAPNQNYARELLELFTIGPTDRNGTPNYTESDVLEAARALTGWRIRPTGTVGGVTTVGTEVYFDAARYDTGTKTILGQTGLWAYDDVVRIVFEQRPRQVAAFIARKMLAFYVSAAPDATVEAALADVLLGGSFRLRPALETLLASEHFFDAGHRGALLKSPLDVYIGALADLGATAFNATYVRNRARERDLDLLNPPNVSGWPGFNPPSSGGLPGYTAWYAADDFGPLWSVLGALVDKTNAVSTYDPLDFIRHAPTPPDPFSVAVSIAERLVGVPLAYASVLPNDAPLAGNPAIPPPDYVVHGPRYLSDLGKMLLGTMPHYEWSASTDAVLAARVQAYLKALYTTVPETLVF